MNGDISLQEALKIINRNSKDGGAHPFDISVRTLNRNSKTGGALKVIKRAKRLDFKSKQNPSISLMNNVLVSNSFTKNPNHWENKTRNILLPNGKIQKIHIRLIISINDHKVVY